MGFPRIRPRLVGRPAGVAGIDVSKIDLGCTRQCTFHYFECDPEPRTFQLVNEELVVRRIA